MKNEHIDKSVLLQLNAEGRELKKQLFEQGILCINIMGSPGSGKTTFIEGLLKSGNIEDFAIIQGDLESDVDKKRLEKMQAYVYQINTHSGCHLNPQMITQALQHMNLKGKKFLLIENVGNLVCPANVDIGQHVNLVISSTTEGYDKPKKYPIIFFNADILIISKYDLKEAVEFDEEAYMKDISELSVKAKVFRLGKHSSYEEVLHLLNDKRNKMLQ
jgi:hydrogenase nickel incorporation protein HypB